MIRYLITDGSASKDEKAWLAQLDYWFQRGVDLMQIRERDLSARDLVNLTRKVLALPNPRGTRVLVNDRIDIAVACGAHGVHLCDRSIRPREVKDRWPRLTVSAACHDASRVKEYQSADYLLLSPVFAPLSKEDSRPALGLGVLNEACTRSAVPILALGGVTKENEGLCLMSGAAGIAGISYFVGARR